MMTTQLDSRLANQLKVYRRQLKKINKYRQEFKLPNKLQN